MSKGRHIPTDSDRRSGSNKQYSSIGSDNGSSLIQIMACRLDDAKPLSESKMISLPTHICVTRPQ